MPLRDGLELWWGRRILSERCFVGWSDLRDTGIKTLFGWICSSLKDISIFRRLLKTILEDILQFYLNNEGKLISNSFYKPFKAQSSPKDLISKNKIVILIPFSSTKSKKKSPKERKMTKRQKKPWEISQMEKVSF